MVLHSGTSGQIRIRGNRTLTTTQAGPAILDGPLLVLDGIPAVEALMILVPMML